MAANQSSPLMAATLGTINPTFALTDEDETETAAAAPAEADSPPVRTDLPTLGAFQLTELDAEPVPDDPDPYTNGASAYLDELLSDLSTYRYVKQVSVTPALARRLIGLNAENNRNFVPNRSKVYARDITNNRWRKKTGQTIKIATDGTLIDGNHRMHAVDEANKTVVFDLCFGVDPKDIVVIDSHKARTDADTIRAAGGSDLYRSQAIVKWVWAYDAGLRTGASASIRPSSLELEETYLNDRLLFDAAVARGGDTLRRNIAPSAITGTAYYLFARVDKEAADAFFDMLVSGLYGVSDSAARKMSVYHLRERLMRRKFDRLTRPEMLALCIRAWNRRNDEVTKLQIGRDELANANFPKVGK